jgi:hypothetical protein
VVRVQYYPAAVASECADPIRVQAIDSRLRQ